MSLGKDLLLYILAMHESGLSVAELQECLALYEMRALACPKTEDYAEYAITVVDSSFVSPDAVVALTELFAENLVAFNQNLWGKSRAILTTAGKERVAEVLEGPLKKLGRIEPVKNSISQLRGKVHQLSAFGLTSRHSTPRGSHAAVAITSTR